MTYRKRLSCGSTDQCCHVGYAHRHCEHCNEVIATYPYTWPAPTHPTVPSIPQWWQQPIITTDTAAAPAPWLGDPVIGGGGESLGWTAGNIPALADHTCEVRP